MKIDNKINNLIANMKVSIKRFPMTLIISIILTIILICLGEANLDIKRIKLLERIGLVIALGIPLSLSIKLIIERYFNNEKILSYICNIVGVGFLVLYYFIFLKDYDFVSMNRYIATMISLILAFLFIPRLKKDSDYEYYIMDIYNGFAITFIYSLVLYIGITVILLTINGLFDVNIPGEIFYYMFLIVSLIFGISLLTSKVPNIDTKYIDIKYSKVLKVLLLYIVIPLISIYTGILYIYFGKILITREWPKGLVSHLIVWYSIISIGVIFLITPILEENKLAKIFKS